MCRALPPSHAGSARSIDGVDPLESPLESPLEAAYVEESALPAATFKVLLARSSVCVCACV